MPHSLFLSSVMQFVRFLNSLIPRRFIFKEVTRELIYRWLQDAVMPQFIAKPKQ